MTASHLAVLACLCVGVIFGAPASDPELAQVCGCSDLSVEGRKCTLYTCYLQDDLLHIDLGNDTVITKPQDQTYLSDRCDHDGSDDESASRHRRQSGDWIRGQPDLRVRGVDLYGSRNGDISAGLSRRTDRAEVGAYGGANIFSRQPHAGVRGTYRINDNMRVFGRAQTGLGSGRPNVRAGIGFSIDF